MPDLAFTKVEGTQNDFVLLDGARPVPTDIDRFAQTICHRHKGVGADGVLVVDSQPFPWMRMWNPDGSEAETCGNGLRCAISWLHAQGRWPTNPGTIATQAGLVTGHWIRQEADTMWTETHLPTPSVVATEPVPEPIRQIVANQTHRWTRVQLGNPHRVLKVDDLAATPLEAIGLLAQREVPGGTNVEIVCVEGDSQLGVRVFERGVGETLSCGSGAAASVVAAIHQRWLAANHATTHLPGGNLEVGWSSTDGPVAIGGPARMVFQGEWRDANPRSLMEAPNGS